MDFKKMKEELERVFKQKHFTNILILVLILLFLLVAVSVLKPKFNGNKNNSSEETLASVTEEEKTKIRDEYEREQKDELTSILNQMSGVGDVDVMIRFESGEVKVPAYDKNTQNSVTEETDGEGGKRVNEQKNDGTTVVMSNENGDNSPFVIQTYKPKVVGIVIVAEGAKDSKIKYDIEKAVSNLYDISIDKVNVYPKGSKHIN